MNLQIDIHTDCRVKVKWLIGEFAYGIVSYLSFYNDIPIAFLQMVSIDSPL